MSGLFQRSRFVRCLVSLGMFAVTTFALMEIALHIVVRVQPDMIFAATGSKESWWEKRFLERHANNEYVFGGLHDPHPTRGWTPKKNFAKRIYGRDYTLNEHGYRSRRRYVDDPSKFTVLLVGDSFTFGISADDTEIWPVLLEERNPSLNVINLGVAGYGIGQMYITLRESIQTYRPNLTIAAFITDNLDRTLLSFRDYKKPRFVLVGDSLVLSNTPIGAVDETYEEVKRKYRMLEEGVGFEILTPFVLRSVSRTIASFG